MIVGTILSVLISAEDEQREARDDVQLVRARLDLSFAELSQGLHHDGADAEEARKAMAEWRRENQRELAWLRDEHRRRRESQILDAQPLLAPTTPPHQEELSDEDFLSAADSYFPTAHEAFFGQVLSPDDAEAARDQLGRWLNRPVNLRLRDRVSAAKERMASRTRDVVAEPLSAAELAALEPEDRITEEIHSLVYQVVRREPLAEGEELRDRLREVSQQVEIKNEELRAVRRQHAAARLQDEVSRLRAHRDRLEQTR